MKFRLRFSGWRNDEFFEKFSADTYPTFEAAFQTAEAIAEAIETALEPETLVNESVCGGIVSLSFAHMAVETFSIKVVEDGGADMA